RVVSVLILRLQWYNLIPFPDIHNSTIKLRKLSNISTADLTRAIYHISGTAGVWRIAAIDDAGGWKDRTTVEDMDLAVRATLKGWKFLYVSDIQVCQRSFTCF